MEGRRLPQLMPGEWIWHCPHCPFIAPKNKAIENHCPDCDAQLIFLSQPMGD